MTASPSRPRRQRVIPAVRDPALELSLVKSIATGDNHQRAATVQDTDGEPLLQFEGRSNPYLEHQRNDLLLSLQHMRS
jgi:tryptophan 2,3-dioxygenase